MDEWARFVAAFDAMEVHFSLNVEVNATRFMCGLFTIEFQNKFRPINHRQRRHMTFVDQSLSSLPLNFVDIILKTESFNQNINKKKCWLTR